MNSIRVGSHYYRLHNRARLTYSVLLVCLQPVYGSKPIAADRYVYEHFGGEFTYDHVWFDIGILLAYIVALRIGTFLTLSFVRHINR